MNESEPQVNQAQSDDNHGRLYWMRVNLTRITLDFVKRHKILVSVLVMLLLIVVVHTRAYYHPLMIVLRQHIFLITWGGPWVLVIWLVNRFLLRERLRWLRLSLWGFVGVLFIGLIATGFAPYHYIAQAYRYNSTLNLVDLKNWPTTDHERIHPLRSAYTLANKATDESETPMEPDFVRIEEDGGESYRWTIGVEPAYALPRMFGNVEEILSGPATTATPDFGGDNRSTVHFECGEGMLLGKSSAHCVTRNLPPWMYFNYEPTNVRYLKDDNGQWVQVVSLVRWTGLWFIRPEFGGVYIIRQVPENDNIWNKTLRVVFGQGEWVSPRNIGNHEFLKRQNIYPYLVSRDIANSLRFQNGFFAPFPGYHIGDIHIPDLAEDVNDQPFTTYIDLPEEVGDSKLYQYFALEPFSPGKRGLNTSLYVPADGIGPTFVYKHFVSEEGLVGVSGISQEVIASRKNLDWTTNRPVEHRPFIRVIDGEPYWFWLTGIVSLGDGEQFSAGARPEIVITDASLRIPPVWVDSFDASTWEDQIRLELEKLGPTQ